MSAPGETSRLFVALPVPDAVKTRLAALQASLRPHLSPSAASWPRPENLHLTLRFLGDVPDEHIDALKGALTAIAARTAPLDLSAQGVGCFPDLRRPAVLWAGIEADIGQLGTLYKEIVAATTAFAQKPAERNFAGHITLARLKRLRAREVERVKGFVREAARQPFGAWAAKEFLLMRSELAPGGSCYTTVASFPFRSGGQPQSTNFDSNASTPLKL